ncbi:hypothetical protein DFH09DRAFT_1482433 [Mycena vulgaris]|nr:hypothetical protein DFH09DRAFT_1482433 [Mycena vulgaris]
MSNAVERRLPSCSFSSEKPRVRLRQGLDLRSPYMTFAHAPSSALRLAPSTKRLAYGGRKEVRVVVLEKGGQVGAPMLSGAVIEPSALDALLPDWRETEYPLSQPVASSFMRFLISKYAIPLPHPPQMKTTSRACPASPVAAWLDGVAAEFNAELYAGFASARLLLSESSDATDAQGRAVRSVRGGVTHDAGLTRQRTKSACFEPGVAFRARATLLAEGAHGSLSKSAITLYDLRARSEAQTHVPGSPGGGTYGGEWEYHMADGLMSIGLVVSLACKNPWLEPHREFQRMKEYPQFRALLTAPGTDCLACSAGVVNTAKIKGTHNAMRTGMLAAEAAFAGLHPRSSPPAHPLLPLPPPSLPPPPPPTPTGTSASIL